jgi:hypothetical protein
MPFSAHLPRSSCLQWSVNFPRSRSLDQLAPFNTSLGQFDFLFAQSSGLADDDSVIWCDFDALQAPYFVPSQGKQAWTLGQNVNGPIAEWLSHLGSQFYGEL